MGSVIDTIGRGLGNTFLMAWEVWWALVLGFAISAVVQAWVPRPRIEAALGGGGARPIALATGLGAASSSCSYAAIAIAKSLFEKGASAASALAFQFASTNLVVELGAVIWLLIGWQFALGEFVGGLVMVLVMTLLLRLFVSRRLEDEARNRAQAADAGHQHHLAGGEQISLRERLTSASAWSDVANNFRNDIAMVWKEVVIGFFLAGFIGLLGNRFFGDLFLVHGPAGLRTIENVVVGPVIAMLSFVCSVGNVPLAAVLWSGGISFAGVIAFVFADLIVLPIVAIYVKYYGRRFAVRITLLMFVTMAAAALVVDGIFGGLGLIPHAHPVRSAVFGSVAVDYKLFLNVLGLGVFAGLLWLSARRSATDPVCGMKVDRQKGIHRDDSGQTVYFCSQGCADRFPPTPSAVAGRSPAPGGLAHTHR
ncbi:MAG TPA: permease [Solirubrobacteraceae bacterium]|jgi:hypothetical protein|nr:permease [Solirubrobacteraceae bacterium]